MPEAHFDFIKSGSAKLFYLDYPSYSSDAPVLILLHGNGEDHSYFSNQVDAFSAHFRLILVDTRGHGKSESGSEKLDFSVFAQDLLRLMDYLQIPKAHLLGFSDGGNTALTFALAHPERVSSLILNGANLNPHGVKFFTQFPVVLGYYCCRLFCPFSKQAQHNADILGLMVHHPHISTDSLTTLTMPCMVIVGEDDMIKDSHSRLIASSLPHAKFVCIQNSNHFCAAKSPKEFNREVLEFLAPFYLK